MYKSTLGLGLGSAKKSDLNVYLKTLEKKNKEVQRKFSTPGTETVAQEEAEKSRVDTEDDSDLLSIKKEFEEEFDSPFIKKTVERRQSAIDEIPEAAEVPFISSLAVPRSTAGAGVGSALNSFMKYDKKWRGKEGIKVSVKKAETDSDSEPVITENSVASPVKIAEELEEKIFPNRRRRKSSNSSGARGAAGLSPSPRSKSGRSRLRLEVNTGLASRKVSHESQPTPIPTVSEMSEGFLSPKSPLFDILNIRDISEVISEDLGQEHVIEEDEEDEHEESSHRLSDLLREKLEKENSVQKPDKSDKTQSQKPEAEPEKPRAKDRNPFHFNASKLHSSLEKTDSEPKVASRTEKSNKRRSEILESVSQINSVIDEVDTRGNREDHQDSESDTLKEIVEKKTRKRWQKEPIRKEDFLQFSRPPLPQESSFESGCYYCRNVCRAHQNLLPTDYSKPPTVRRTGSQVQSEEVGVQAGKPTLHHYLFDPTQDAVFEDISPPGLGFSNVSIDTNKIDIATSSIIDLMKKQLALMEHSMRSQKQLYRSFCVSLEKSQQRRMRQEPEDRVLFGKSKKPVKLTFEEALRQVKAEMKQQKREMREISRSCKSSEFLVKSKSHRTVKTPENNSSIAENIDEYETDFESSSEIRTESSVGEDETSGRTKST